MDKKKFAKRYILSLTGLYFFGAVFLFLLLFFLSSRNDVTNALEINQVIALSLALPLLPCASYTGFVLAFKNIKELNKLWIIAICIFFPVTLLFITIYGAIMIVPSLIKNTKLLFERIE